jgi:hypothetical protein
MPEPEEFRRSRQRRATPFAPNLAFPTPNLDPRGFSRASSTSSWEMQPSPVSFKTRLDTTRIWVFEPHVQWIQGAMRSSGRAFDGHRECPPYFVRRSRPARARCRLRCSCSWRAIFGCAKRLRHAPCSRGASSKREHAARRLACTLQKTETVRLGCGPTASLAARACAEAVRHGAADHAPLAASRARVP